MLASNYILWILISLSVFLALVLYFYKQRITRINEELKLIRERSDFVLKARDTLLRSVNHELRAPLTRMKMDLEFLAAGETKNSLSTDIEYMQRLVEELMEIEKVSIDQTQRKEIQLTGLLRRVLETLKIDLDETVLDLQENITIYGHEYQLEKLFKNLIENANKYKAKTTGRVHLKLIQDRFDIIITIINDGEVIPAQDLPFIFEPFFRVDKSRSSASSEGLGLGLNICREIIDAHGGKIRVSSKKDMGTIFKVSFPNKN